MEDPIARQLAFNALSREAWSAFEAHRVCLGDLLTGETSKGKLCVLGAGNCNDLDLARLLNHYREVHLVDIDARSLDEGVTRQGIEVRSRIVLHGGLDLTAMFDLIARWTPETPLSQADFQGLIDRPSQQVPLALGGRFDTVVSTCLLSQLIASIKHAIGERHQLFIDAVQAVRLGHLRLLAKLTQAGGTGFLVTDIVSSDSLPSLIDLPESSLRELLPLLNRDRNFFHGVNPLILWNLFRQDPLLVAETSELQAVDPWRWDLGIRRYLVVALRFRGSGPR